MKRIPSTIVGYIFIILLLQTLYRWIYYLLPWGMNEHPSSDYLTAVKFFEPNSLSIIVTVIFGAGLLWAIIDSKETQ